ncbi:MAG: phenylacetate--CoA ligase family protein [Candidatus Omnitrophota bacterium]
MQTYSKIYRNVLFPFYETIVKRRNTLSYLKELEYNQWRPEKELRIIQWNKLSSLLRHAYEKVPYYRDKFMQHNVNPSKILTPEDFRKIPFLTKSDIQSNGAALIAENYIDRNLCKNETGGSTGEPINFVYPRESYEWRIAAAARSNRWAGWDFGMKTTVLWGRPVSPISKIKQAKLTLHNGFMRRQFINAFDLSEASLKGYLQKINRYRPLIIEAYVSLIYTIAKFAKMTNMMVIKPKAIIASAETLHDYQRELIESVFECKVFNRYGCSEMMLVAAECGEHTGLHLNLDNIYIEFLKDNIPVKEGELGEIVLTDMNNYGMPFIRYKIGDIGVPSGKTCACGRGLPLTERVEGRTMDILLGKNGKFIQPQAFCFLFREFDWIKQYQIVQERKGSLLFNIIRNRDFSDIERNLFLRRVREVVKDDVDLDIKLTNEIPLSDSGKYRVVISKVPIEFGNN